MDHKEIGLRYIVTAFVLLLAGGAEAMAMRLQLAGPERRLLDPEAYNQLFTMHGATMIFLYASPILTGFSNYLWPLLMGSRDMAFPRLNAFSYWVYLASAIFMYGGFVVGHGPDDGWFNYVPYASKTFDPGINIDVYALGLILLGISTTVGSANFVVTFLRTRAPGMSINRVPILIWGTLTASTANILVVPSVSLAFFLLWLDRSFGFHFYDAREGQPLLWQHLFWMFGHPWVYAIVLPAMGMVSDALPTFCRRPLVGYTPVALSTVGTMTLGFGVWVHHMFATGLPTLALAFFSGASLIITLPSAVVVFAWIATIWTGRPVITTPFLFFASMIVLFTIGGVSGVMTASAPVDWQLNDTYFVVAHLHYVLIGINVFPVVGAIYYWFPKMTGRLLDERLGRWNFWTMFIGFNAGFLPMHTLGLAGMPRRIYTYPAALGWSTQNLIVSLGSALFAIGVLLLLVNVIVSLQERARGGERSVGRADAGVVRLLAAAALQFRGDPDPRQPSPALGRPARREARPLPAEARTAARQGPRDHRHLRARRRAEPDPRDAGREPRPGAADHRHVGPLRGEPVPRLVADGGGGRRLHGGADLLAVAGAPPRTGMEAAQWLTPSSSPGTCRSVPCATTPPAGGG